VVEQKQPDKDEFLELIREQQKSGNAYFAAYDIDRNVVTIAVSDSRERVVNKVLVSPVFFYLEKDEYDRFKNDLAGLLPDLFKETGHMW
jgi:hypothetical protein